MSDKFNLSISIEEAIVLFEFLSRNNEGDRLEGLTEDQSELRALWNLEASLEEGLSEPLSSGWAETLKAARDKIRDPED